MVAGPHKTYLTRAMGAEEQVGFDHVSEDVEVGDLFMLVSDGVHDFLSAPDLLSLFTPLEDNLEQLAGRVCEKAVAAGSDDNVTCVLVRVTRLPNQETDEFYRQLTATPFPPPLSVGMEWEGLRILREVYTSKHTQLYQAVIVETGQAVILKTPSVNYLDDPEYIDRFIREEWIGRRIDSPHVVKVVSPPGERRFLYFLTEYVEGQNLGQWMNDHPKPSLAEIRNIVGQTAQGLRAFHRAEMVHHDLKPENVLMDRMGVVKLIDFGAAEVGGLDEIQTPLVQPGQMGTANYLAPEYFEGYRGTPQSDMYSLGVLTHHLLTRKYPYPETARLQKSRFYQYIPARQTNERVPVWMDNAIKKAVSHNPDRRYRHLSEFIHDLSTPNPALTELPHAPLLERDPVAFWKAAAVIFLLLNLIQLGWVYG